MTNADTARFATALAYLRASMPNAPVISAEIAAVYEDVLGDLPIEAIERGVRVFARRNAKFWPNAGELRAVCEGRGENQAELAWLDVVKEVRRVGWCGTPKLSPATMETIEGMFGSWRNLCESLPGPDSPMFAATVKNFKAAHAALAERREDARYLDRAEAKRALASVLKGVDAHRRGLALASGGKR